MDRPEYLWNRLQRDGEAAIKEMVNDFDVENQWLDFKRSGGFGTANSNSIGDSDFNNLSKSVSAFANTDGGLIIWGVDCKKRNGLEIPSVSNDSLVTDPIKLKSLLEGATSRCTSPVVSGVSHIHLSSALDSPAGYVVTYVPRSHAAPHKANHERRYYFRSGSNSVEVPDIVLAAMFGRRPISEVEVVFTRTIQAERNSRHEQAFLVDLTVYLHNKGPRIINHPYLTLKYCIPSPQSTIQVQTKLTNNSATDWRESRSDSFGMIGGRGYGGLFTYSLSAVNDYLLPPGQEIETLKIQYHLIGPFSSDLIMNLAYGHEESPVREIDFNVSLGRLTQMYPLLYKHEAGGHGNRDKFIREWIGLTEYTGYIHETGGRPSLL